MTVSDGIGRAYSFFWAGLSTAGVTLAGTEAVGIETVGS
jgi:hypothetical protein